MLHPPRPPRQSFNVNYIHSGPLTKDALFLGLKQNRAVIEFRGGDDHLTRQWVEELIADGKAFASEWRIHPARQETYRVISAEPLAPGSAVRFGGNTYHV